MAGCRHRRNEKIKKIGLIVSAIVLIYIGFGIFFLVYQKNNEENIKMNYNHTEHDIYGFDEEGKHHIIKPGIYTLIKIKEKSYKLKPMFGNSNYVTTSEVYIKKDGNVIKIPRDEQKESLEFYRDESSEVPKNKVKISPVTWDDYNADEKLSTGQVTFTINDFDVKGD